MERGYSYYVEDEKLKAYMKLSTEEKLIWLEEINELTRSVLTPKEKEIREKFRKAEI